MAHDSVEISVDGEKRNSVRISPSEVRGGTVNVEFKT
jgi:hypothetical protein